MFDLNFSLVLLGQIVALTSDEPDHRVNFINSTRASSFKQISYWDFFGVLGHDMIFPELQLKSSYDLLGVARQLGCDYLCKIWERNMEFWSRFHRFFVRPFSC
jgi:hypothetical protein